MTYTTFHITLINGTKLDVVAVSIEAAKADITYAYEDAEILTYSMSEEL